MNNIKDNDSLDLAGLIRNYIKNWKVFLITIAVCGLIAYLYTKIVPPTYQILANVLVVQEDEKSGKGGNMQSMLARSFGGSIGGGNVDDEIYVLTSYSNISNVVKYLGLYKSHSLKTGLFQKKDLYKDFPVDVYAPQSLLDTLSIAVSFKINVSQDGSIYVKVKGKKGVLLGEKSAKKFPLIFNTTYGTFTVYETKYYKPGKELTCNISVSGYGSVAEEFSHKLKSEIPGKRTNVICMGIEDNNINRGTDFLNTLIQLYNERGLEQKNLEAERTATFIDERLKIISGELYNVEKEIENYKIENKILDVGADAQVAYNKRESYAETQLQAELNDHIIKLIEDFVNNPDNKGSFLISTSGVVDSAVDSYNALLSSKRELLRTAKRGNPVIKRVDDQIDIAWKNIKDQLEVSKKEKNISLSDIKKLESKMQDKVSKAPSIEREFLGIKRQQAIKEELFMFLLQKREDNAITLAANTPKGQIVDPAYNLSKPISLPKLLILLIGLVVGFFIAAAYLYVKELFRTKFSTKEELEKITTLPITGEVCVNHSDQNIVVKEGDNSSISELFRLIRTNLQFLLSGNSEKVILITSSVSGEGKSFISSNLAASLALTGKRVLLIGSDIRQPKLKEYLNVKSTKGLTNYLASADMIEEDIIVKSPFFKNLDVILSGPVPPNPAELLLSNRLDNLCNKLRDLYDYIIIDSAPVGMVSDTLSLNRISDITLYVCRANYTEKGNIAYA
ncbi:MAG: polysaccharide biosynthesis tyrosine autokinase, partial [Bacteroidales bacterium]